MRISDWSSDVCSSDLTTGRASSIGAAAGLEQEPHALFGLIKPVIDQARGCGIARLVANIAGPAKRLHIGAVISRQPAQPGAGSGEIRVVENGRAEGGESGWQAV